MSIESKSDIGHSSIFDIRQGNFKKSGLLHKMAKGFISNAITVPEPPKPSPLLPARPDVADLHELPRVTTHTKYNVLSMTCSSLKPLMDGGRRNFFT